MPNRLTKVPVAVYVPAVPSVQGRAAYCVNAPVIVGYTSAGGGSLAGASGGSLSGSKLTYFPPNPYDTNGSGTWLSIPTPILDGSASGVRISTGMGGYTSQLKPRYETKTTCYPAIAAVPGSPARIDYQANSGWNSGARSREAIPPFGAFRGTMLSTLVATQFGLSDRFFSHTYAHMTHSIVARPGEWSIVERGITVATGTLPDLAILEIRRLGSTVVYLANDTELYTSTVPIAGEVYGAAMMYSLGDGVDSPSISTLEQVIRFSGFAPRWTLLASDSADHAFLNSTLPMATLAATGEPVYGVLRFSGEVPVARAVGADRHVVFMQAEGLPWALHATAGRPERQLTQLTALLPPAILSATAIAGTTASMVATMRSFPFIAADRTQVVFLKADLPMRLRLDAYEPYMPLNQFDGMDAAVAYDEAVLQSALLLIGMDSLEVSGTVELFMFLELFGMDSLELDSTASLGQLVELLAMEQVAVNSTASTAQRQALQYAVNIVSGALSVYEGFDFHGFASVARDTYAYRPDGVYRIGGSLDNGDLLQALIDFGTTDFASNLVKRAQMAYLGVRTDGQCFLRVRMDSGRERVYRVRGAENVRRSKLAEGVSGRSLSLALELVDASFVEVDSIEVIVGATQRRGFGVRN